MLNGVVILEKIKDTHAPFYRPVLPEQESAGVHPGILTLMKQCWAEEPSERPSFDDVIKSLKSINKGKSASLLYLTFEQHFVKKEHLGSAYLRQGKSGPDPDSG